MTYRRVTHEQALCHHEWMSEKNNEDMIVCMKCQRREWLF